MTKQLIDKVLIQVKAGDGGSGAVSFKREKYAPNGGPNGGDGGNGGNVYFVADHNMATLLDFRSKPKYEAQDGERGGKKKMFGEYGEDLYIKIPIGTLVYEETSNGPVLIGDMISDGQTLLVAQGGYGGKGNTRFKSSTNQVPTQFTEGTKRQVKNITLEIKLVADIGLVGFPNAGKSTLINHLTNAKAKTASYPFTTITPNLAPFDLKNGQSVILADIPGLIEGASEGKGLGDDFLRHIERTRILVHIIDPTVFEEGISISDNALQMYEAIRKELISYGAHLEDKPEIVVINKLDLFDVKEKYAEIEGAFAKRGIKVIGISALVGNGLDILENCIIDTLQSAPKRVVFYNKEQKPVKVYTITTLPNRRIVRL